MPGTRRKVRIRTKLLLGIQFDEFDFRVFLRDYHRELRSRFPEESFPAYSTGVVLDSLMEQYEEACQEGRPGARREVMQEFARRVHRLDLALTGSDYGPLERRSSPYEFDRVFYHLGRQLVSAEVNMDFPGFNPYRSTRQINIPYFRDNVEEVVEFVPDYLWWEIHDKQDVIQNALVPEHLHEIRKRIERVGYKVDSFGLYMTTMEELL